MKYLYIILILVFASDVFSQSKQIKSSVLDAETKKPLVGVNISNQNNQSKSISNSQGEFVIEVNKMTDKISFSYVGYERLVISASNIKRKVFLSEKRYELEGVVVTSNRDSLLRKEIPSAITKINSKQLEEINAITFPDILNKVTGVHIADFGNEQQSMSIRMPLSFGRTQMILLEDGVPLGPVSISTPGNIKDINMANIGNIEILRGPASSIYGSEAVGGVVNFITKNPPQTLSANLSSQISSDSYKRLDLFVGDRIGKFGYTISGYIADKNNGYRENTDFKKQILSIKTNYLINNKSNITFLATYSDYYTDFSGSLDSLTFYQSPEKNHYSFHFSKTKLFRSYLRYYREWNKKSKSFVTAFYRNQNNNDIPSYLTRRNMYFPPFGPPQVYYTGEDIKTSYNSIGVIAQHKQEFNFMKSKLIFGVSLNYTPNQYNSKLINVNRDAEGYYTSYETTDEYVQNFNATLKNYASYISYEFQPIEKVNVSASVRYDRLDYDFENLMDSAGITCAPSESNTFQNVSPKIGITYNPINNFGLYTNYSMGFAPPLFSQLYKEVVVPVLKPSIYNSYEIGLFYGSKNGKLYYDLSVFNIDGQNEIVKVLLDDGSEQSKSVGETSHKGIESSVRYKIFNSVELNANAIYAEHKYIQFTDASLDYSGNEMSQAPNLIAFAGLAYKPSFINNFRISAEMQYIGEYYMDGLNTEKYPGYTLLNLRASYNFKNLGVWFNILNATDELYAARVSKSYYGPVSVKSYSVGMPRTFYIGLKYKFKAKK